MSTTDADDRFQLEGDGVKAAPASTFRPGDRCRCRFTYRSEPVEVAVIGVRPDGAVMIRNVATGKVQTIPERSTHKLEPMEAAQAS
jgi:hypothetical protein